MRLFNEIWIVDHSTTTAQAKTSSGGRYGKGGDILYRWGNPHAYKRGTTSDQQLWGQHDANWIEDGKPGAGNILLYNNGNFRPAGNISTVEEITPPVDATGNYTLAPGTAFGPAAPTWNYTANPPESFWSSSLSGAYRLQNGNTLITEGLTGRIFEVDPSGATVWQYVNGFPSGGAPSVFKARRYERYLFMSNTQTLRASTGGSVEFDVIAGSKNAGTAYLLLASLSGTSPGTLAPDGTTLVPLNVDALTLAVLGALNSPCFDKFGTLLDPLGNGHATLTVPNPLGPSMVGATIDFAYMLVPRFELVSNPVSVQVVP